MSESLALILFVVGIVLTIFIGNKFKINIGAVAIAITYFYYVLGMGNKPGDLLLLWPTKTFMTILCITYFFGFANENGALANFATHAVWRFRKFPAILPFVFFVVGGMITGCGANPYAPGAILIPVVVPLCIQTGLSPLLGCIMVNTGALYGSVVPWGEAGSLLRTYVDKGPYVDDAARIIANMTLSITAFAVVFGVISFFFFKGYKLKNVEHLLKEPEPYTKEQKASLTLILVLLLIMIIPSIGGSLGSAALKTISKKINIAPVCLILGVVSGLLKLANETTVVTKRVPWKTLLMLGGVSMLVAAAESGGAVALIGRWIGTSVPSFLQIPMMALLGAIMSVFVPGSTVATPTLWALIPGITSMSNVSYMGLYHAAFVGASSTAISPFSGGGSLTLASIDDSKIRDEMFTKLIIAAGASGLVATLLAFTGIYSI